MGFCQFAQIPIPNGCSVVWSYMIQYRFKSKWEIFLATIVGGGIAAISYGPGVNEDGTTYVTYVTHLLVDILPPNRS